MFGFGEASVCSLAVAVGWTLEENVKLFTQELVVLLWKSLCRCLLMLEEYCRKSGLLCEGLSMRCSRGCKSSLM